jgi:hypothetical protein
MNYSSPHLFTVAQLSELLFRNASSQQKPAFHPDASERKVSVLEQLKPQTAGLLDLQPGSEFNFCAAAAVTNAQLFSFQI